MAVTNLFKISINNPNSVMVSVVLVYECRHQITDNKHDDFLL